MTKKKLFAFKHGDLQSGNWTWALGAENKLGPDRLPYHVADINFHGAKAAGWDHEELAEALANALILTPEQRAEINPRRPLEEGSGYLESDRDWFDNNREACVWFLAQIVGYAPESEEE
jgi:hypothetical protein